MAAGDGNFNAFQRYLDARDRMAYVREHAEDYEGGNTAEGYRRRRNAINNLREAEEAARKSGPPTAAKPKPVVGKPAAPVKPAEKPPLAFDTGKSATSPAAAGMPRPPAAVTDPQSEIAPAEQAARLRARLQLMNVTRRTGGGALGTSGLSYRNLIGM